MKKIRDYLAHATECRDMARTVSPSHRKRLIQMAETWEELAASRKQKLERSGKTEEELEPDEPARGCAGWLCDRAHCNVAC